MTEVVTTSLVFPRLSKDQGQVYLPGDEPFTTQFNLVQCDVQLKGGLRRSSCVGLEHKAILPTSRKELGRERLRAVKEGDRAGHCAGDHDW